MKSSHALICSEPAFDDVAGAQDVYESTHRERPAAPSTGGTVSNALTTKLPQALQIVSGGDGAEATTTAADPSSTRPCWHRGARQLDPTQASMHDYISDTEDDHTIPQSVSLRHGSSMMPHTQWSSTAMDTKLKQTKTHHHHNISSSSSPDNHNNAHRMTIHLINRGNDDTNSSQANTEDWRTITDNRNAERGAAGGDAGIGRGFGHHTDAAQDRFGEHRRPRHRWSSSAREVYGQVVALLQRTLHQYWHRRYSMIAEMLSPVIFVLVLLTLQLLFGIVRVEEENVVANWTNSPFLVNNFYAPYLCYNDSTQPIADVPPCDQVDFVVQCDGNESGIPVRQLCYSDEVTPTLIVRRFINSPLVDLSSIPTLDTMILMQWLAKKAGMADASRVTADIGSLGGAGLGASTKTRVKSIAYSGKLYFAPARNVPADLVDFFARDSQLFHHVYGGTFESVAAAEASLRAAAADMASPDSTWAVVVIDDITDGFDVTIRLSSNALPELQSLAFIDYPGGFQTGGSEMYVASGFSTIQRCLYTYFLEHQRARNRIRLAFDPAHAYPLISPFPTVSFTRLDLFFYTARITSFLLVLSFLYPFSQMTKRMVHEKELRIRETMLILGLRKSSLWICFFLTNLLEFFVISLAFVLTLHFLVMQRSEIGVMLLIVTIFTSCLVPLAGLVSTLFNSTRLASLLAPLLYFMLSIPVFAMGNADVKTMLSLGIFAPTAFSQALSNVASAEAGRGYRLRDVTHDTYFRPKMQYMLLILAADFVGYSLLMLYIDAVLPQEWGTTKHPLFFLLDPYRALRRCRGRGASRAERRAGAQEPISVGRTAMGCRRLRAATAWATGGGAARHPARGGRVHDAKNIPCRASHCPTSEVTNDDDANDADSSNNTNDTNNDKRTKRNANHHRDSVGHDENSNAEDCSLLVTRVLSVGHASARGQRAPHMDPTLGIDPHTGARKRVAVRLVGLHKTFSRNDQTFVAVNNLSLRLYQGEITSLLGPNGAGKSTAINLMTGMMQPDGGDCFIEGRSITHDKAAARRRIGFCPQHNILWPDLTCRQQLEFFSRIKGLSGAALRATTTHILAQVDLLDKEHYTPSMLSGGQKRKLSVAIAFVGGARVVFLDEPTAGMDAVARRHIWSLIRSMAARRTIVLTTHYMDEADLLGDQVVIISSGALQCAGSSLFLRSCGGVCYCLRFDLTPLDPAQAERERRASSAESPASLRRVWRTIDIVVRQHCPAACRTIRTNSEIEYNLPEGCRGHLPQLLRGLERYRNEELGIRSYSLMAPSLEEVFLRIIEEDSHGQIAANQRQTHTSRRAAEHDGHVSLHGGGGSRSSSSSNNSSRRTGKSHSPSAPQTSRFRGSGGVAAAAAASPNDVCTTASAHAGADRALHGSTEHVRHMSEYANSNRAQDNDVNAGGGSKTTPRGTSLAPICSHVRRMSLQSYRFLDNIESVYDQLARNSGIVGPSMHNANPFVTTNTNNTNNSNNSNNHPNNTTTNQSNSVIVANAIDANNMERNRDRCEPKTAPSHSVAVRSHSDGMPHIHQCPHATLTNTDPPDSIHAYQSDPPADGQAAHVATFLRCVNPGTAVPAAPVLAAVHTCGDDAAAMALSIVSSPSQLHSHSHSQRMMVSQAHSRQLTSLGNAEEFSQLPHFMRCVESGRGGEHEGCMSDRGMGVGMTGAADGTGFAPHAVLSLANANHSCKEEEEEEENVNRDNAASASLPVDVDDKTHIHNHGLLTKPESDECLARVWQQRRPTTHSRLMLMQLRAAVTKRIRYAMRDRLTLFFQIVFPVLSIMLAMLFQLSSEKPATNLSVHAGMYGNTVVIETARCDAYLDMDMRHTVPLYGHGLSHVLWHDNPAPSMNASALASRLLQVWFRPDEETSMSFTAVSCVDDEVGIFLRQIDAERYRDVAPYTVFFNTSSGHSLPYAMHVWSMTMYLRGLQDAGASAAQMEQAVFRLTAATLPRVAARTKSSNTISTILIALIMLIPFTFVPGNPVLWVVKERENMSRNLQRMAGLNHWLYWLGNFIFDFTSYVVSLGLVFATFAAFRRWEFVGADVIAASTMTFVLYGLCCCWGAYVLSFLFHDHTNAQIVVLGCSFLSGYLLVLTLFVLNLMEKTEEVAYQMGWFFRLVPSFAVGEMIMNLALLPQKRILNPTVSAWDMNITGWASVYLACELPLLVMATLFWDHPHRAVVLEHWRLVWGSKKSLPRRCGSLLRSVCCCCCCGGVSRYCKTAESESEEDEQEKEEAHELADEMTQHMRVVGGAGGGNRVEDAANPAPLAAQPCMIPMTGMQSSPEQAIAPAMTAATTTTTTTTTTAAAEVATHHMRCVSAISAAPQALVGTMNDAAATLERSAKGILRGHVAYPSQTSISQHQLHRRFCSQNIRFMVPCESVGGCGTTGCGAAAAATAPHSPPPTPFDRSNRAESEEEDEAARVDMLGCTQRGVNYGIEGGAARVAIHDNDENEDHIHNGTIHHACAHPHRGYPSLVAGSSTPVQTALLVPSAQHVAANKGEALTAMAMTSRAAVQQQQQQQTTQQQQPPRSHALALLYKPKHPLARTLLTRHASDEVYQDSDVEEERRAVYADERAFRRGKRARRLRAQMDACKRNDCNTNSSSDVYPGNHCSTDKNNDSNNDNNNNNNMHTNTNSNNCNDNTTHNESRSDMPDIVRLVDLCKVYDRTCKVAVRSLSLGVMRGEVFGFLGTNGAGKSTTIAMVTQEQRPTAGRAYLCGYDVVRESAQAMRCIGYCPQRDACFDLLTVQEHLDYYGAIHGLSNGTPSHASASAAAANEESSSNRVSRHAPHTGRKNSGNCVTGGVCGAAHEPHTRPEATSTTKRVSNNHTNTEEEEEEEEEHDEKSRSATTTNATAPVKGFRDCVIDSLLSLLDLLTYRHVLACNLSGGNRRKLSVAIALIGAPEVVCLDEPSAGMDPIARRMLWRTIVRVSQRCSIMLTTHHLEEVEALADCVAIMVDGTLRCIGDLPHLKDKYTSNAYELCIRVHRGGQGGGLGSERGQHTTRRGRSKAESVQHDGVLSLNPTSGDAVPRHVRHASVHMTAMSMNESEHHATSTDDDDDDNSSSDRYHVDDANGVDAAQDETSSPIAIEQFMNNAFPSAMLLENFNNERYIYSVPATRDVARAMARLKAIQLKKHQERRRQQQQHNSTTHPIATHLSSSNSHRNDHSNTRGGGVANLHQFYPSNLSGMSLMMSGISLQEVMHPSSEGGGGAATAVAARLAGRRGGDLDVAAGGGGRVGCSSPSSRTYNNNNNNNNNHYYYNNISTGNNYTSMNSANRRAQFHSNALRDIKGVNEIHTTAHMPDEVLNSIPTHIRSLSANLLGGSAIAAPDSNVWNNTPRGNAGDVSCESISMSISYRAALDRIVRLSDIFEALQQSQARLNIMEYSVSQMSLEQVFLRVCGTTHEMADEEEASNDNRNEGACDANKRNGAATAAEQNMTQSRLPSPALPPASSYNCISMTSKNRNGLEYAQLRRSNARFNHISGNV